MIKTVKHDVLERLRQKRLSHDPILSTGNDSPDSAINIQAFMQVKK